jgi:GNAT superfamily N-acetyltransferase
MRVQRVAGTDPVATELVDAMLAELAAIYDAGVFTRTSARPEALSAPHGGFVVLWDGDRAVAGGGVQRLDDRTGEIKRMYVAPDARGHGAGRALLTALEDLARDLGYDVARLDTGPRQAGARRMYERAGYAAIPDYNGNPYAAFWGEKRLRAADQA